MLMTTYTLTFTLQFQAEDIRIDRRSSKNINLYVAGSVEGIVVAGDRSTETELHDE